MCLNCGGSNQFRSHTNKMRSPYGIMGKNLHPIISAPSNSKTEVTIRLPHKYPIWLTYIFFLVLLGSKASIGIDDERTETLIEKVNEILEAFIGIDDLELGKQKKSTPVR